MGIYLCFCLCFYDVALWNNFTAGAVDKIRSAYVKFILDTPNLIALASVGIAKK